MVYYSYLLISLTIIINGLPRCCCNPSKELSLELFQVSIGNLDTQEEAGKWSNCDKYKCFNALQCQINPSRQLLYYVYPPMKILENSNQNLLYSSESMITREYWQLLYTILASSRATHDPNEACLFVPSIDLTFLRSTNSSLLNALYESLPFWRLIDGRPGTNHLVISLDPSHNLEKISNAIGRSILVSNNHDTWSLRPEFDYSIPTLFQRNSNLDSDSKNAIEKRSQWELIFTQYNSIDDRRRQAVDRLEKDMNGDLLVLGHKCQLSKETATSSSEYLRCDNSNDTLEEQDKTKCRCTKDKSLQLGFQYPQILSLAKFCLVFHQRGEPTLGDSSHYLLGEALRHGCVPIISNDVIRPYSTVLNWTQMSLSLTNDVTLENIPKLISSFNLDTYKKMSIKAQETWSNYFSSSSQIAENLMLHYDSLLTPSIISRSKRHHSDL